MTNLIRRYRLTSRGFNAIDILRRLINGVCFLGKQELVFKRHEKMEKLVNQGNYVELLKYTGEYDNLLAEQMGTSTVFMG